ncbi:MAG: zinc ribbon domain-containing protein [Clostridia bacterium]|jgi:putative FmdB family regulatory protein|nr:zinc ribbon domain-containing protein [Clostridia bacterium]
MSLDKKPPNFYYFLVDYKKEVDEIPSYDYRCPACGKFTVRQGIKEKALDACPTCGSPVHRVIGKNVGVLYKCSGFYSTDSKSSAAPAAETAAADT